MSDLKLSLVVQAATQQAQKAIVELVAVEQQLVDQSTAAGKATADALSRTDTAARAATGSAKVLASAERDQATAMDQASAAARRHANDAAGASEAIDHVGHSSTAARREMVVLAHELVTGNYSRLTGSLLVLGEQFDVLGALMSPTAISLASVAAAAAVVFKAFVDATRVDHEFADALQLTGNVSGLTRQRLDELAKSVAGNTSTSVQSASKLLLQLAASGRVAGDSLAPVAEAISNYARLTHQSAEDATKDFEKLFQDPLKFAEALNEQVHFLTLTEYDRIKALQDSGDIQGAVTEVARHLNAQLDEQNAKVKTSGGLWHQLSVYVADAMHFLGERLDPTLDVQIASLQKSLDAQRQVINAAKADGTSDFYISHLENQFATDQAKFQALLDKKASEQQAASTAATKAKHDADLVEAKRYVDGLALTYKAGASQVQAEIDHFNRAANLLVGTPDEISAANRAKIIAGIRQKGSGQRPISATDVAGNSQRTLKAELDQTLATLNASVADGTTTQAAALAQSRRLWADYYGGVVADYQKALGEAAISPAQRQRLQSQLDAAKADAAAKDADLQAQQTELQRKGEQDRAKIVAETLRGIGDTRAAALAQLDADYASTLARLKNKGVTDAQAVADAWKRAQQQAIEVNDLASKVTEVQRKFQDAQVVAGARVQAHEETPASARSDVAAAAKAEIEALKGYRAQILQLLNQYPDNPKLVQTLATIDTELQKTGALGNEVFNQFKQGFQGDIQTFLESVVSGSKSAGQAFVAFGQDVIKTLENIAAEMVAKQIVGGLSNAVGGSSGGLLAFLGSSLSSSSAAAGGGTGGVDAFSIFAAGGGLVFGSGTDTSDNIHAMLSPGEFVVNAKAVRQIGIDTLAAINGGAARRPTRILHFAGGGYVGQALPSAGTASTGPGAVPVKIDNHYDFRGAGPDQLAQLYAYGEKIKRDAVKAVFEARKRGYAPI